MIKTAENENIEMTRMKDRFLEPVQITDIDIPFMSMVWFMVKWAFAAIPAAIIIFMVMGIVIRTILQS